MTDDVPASDRRRGGLAGKRRAILDGARTVFARDGYTRSGLDAIAAAAGVSTRTIYNHFQDKAQLFQAVISDSATRVAEAQSALLERHLGAVSSAAQLEPALVAFGMSWAAPTPDAAEHFALVRQVDAELEHIPPAAIEDWQRTGPRRVRRECAHHIGRLARAGLLDAPDPDRAALHLLVLVNASDPSLRRIPADPAQVSATVTAGVRTFLYGHAGPRTRPAG